MFSGTLLPFYLSSLGEFILKLCITQVCNVYLDVSAHFPGHICLMCKINNGVSVKNIC